MTIWLDHIKIGMIQTGTMIRDQAVQAIDNTKVQGTTILGGSFMSGITQSDVLAVITGIASIVLIVKLSFDVKKSMTETKKINLDMALMQAREDERVRLMNMDRRKADKKNPDELG